MTIKKSKLWSSFFGVTLRKITGTEKKYQDQFRVRRETLVDGEQRCYPEYRVPGITSEWEQIICINNKYYESSHITYNAPLTLEEARSYIVEFKKKLEHERAKLLLREEILSSEENGEL